MKRTIWLSMTAMLISSAAIAQTTNPPAPAPGPAPAPAPMAAPSASDAATPNTTGTVRQDANAPLAGANSFTEAQAKSRMESSGFTNITDLKKDDAGIWRGKASKDGKSVTVALDFRGNVVAQ